MSRNSVKNQYFATLFASILAITYGALCGWPSASFPILQSLELSPLETGPMTVEEGSWVAAVLCVGGLAGNLFYGWMADEFGRKFTLLSVALPLASCWVFIITAKSVAFLYVARLMGGFGGGGLFVTFPLYVTEISEDRVRGSLGSCLVLMCNLGILLAFICGHFFAYKVVPFIFLSLPIIFFIGFIFLPETPQYLLKKNKTEDAAKSLRYFRNLKGYLHKLPDQFEQELETLKQMNKNEITELDSDKLCWGDFNNKIACKAFLIGVSLTALNQLCGCFAMLNYTATIFKEAGSNMSPNMAAIVVGVIQLLGSYISTLLVERAGRKLLISISAFGTCIGLIGLGVHSYLKMIHYDVFNWLPLVSFSFTIFIASWGVLTLPFLVLSEVMPPKIRSIGSSFCMCTVWVFAFFMIKFLPFLTESLGMHGTMFIFATCSFLGGIFVVVLVPETKGKSIETIMKMLE